MGQQVCPVHLRVQQVLPLVQLKVLPLSNQYLRLFLLLWGQRREML